VTLAECCFDTGGIGVHAALPPALRPSSFALFSESASRVVVSTSPEDLEPFLKRATEAGVPAEVIGETGGTGIQLEAGTASIALSVAEAEQIWSTAIERYFVRAL
jgi:phosphoribosylformylglycinamidine synthase